MNRYILRNHKPVLCNDLLAWSKQFEDIESRIVKQDDVEGAHVSTVFLGLDHAFGGGTPLLFETMVFGGKLDQAQERYATWNEAEAGHAVMCARVRVRSGARTEGTEKT